MALSYPHRVTLDENEKVLSFEDGMKMTFKAGSFEESFQVTIDKIDGQEVNGNRPVSSAYIFKDIKGIEPDKLPVKPLHPAVAVVPILVTDTVSTALTLGTNPGEHPAPDNWTPRPDDIGPPRDGKTTITLGTLETFELLSE